MDALLIQVLDQPAWLVYVVTAAIVFAEDALFVGFVLPGETAAILGGVSASLGNTSVVWMTVFVALAAIVGDSVGYEIGRVYGGRVLELSFLAKRRGRLDQAQAYLRRRGGSAVFLGRWTAFLRAVMPALAGMSRMPYRRFLPWNAIGGTIWGITSVVAGYLAGRSYQRVATWLGGGAAAVVAAVVAIAVVVWAVRRRRSERDASTHHGEGPDAQDVELAAGPERVVD
jgi:membrane protein DedA with SNARE-associated domain